MSTNLTPSSFDEKVINQPFRFLDLPAELRMMVYERIPVPIRITVTDFEKPRRTAGSEPVNYTVITQSTTALAILATCRQIYNEAADILGDSVSEMAATPFRMIADVEVLDWYYTNNLTNNPITYLGMYLNSVKVASTRTLALEPGRPATSQPESGNSDSDVVFARQMRKWALVWEKQRQIKGLNNSQEHVPTLEIALRNEYFTMTSSTIFCRQLMAKSKDWDSFDLVLRLSPDIMQPGLVRFFQREAAKERARVRMTSRTLRAYHGEAVGAVEFEHEWTVGEFDLDERQAE